MGRPPKVPLRELTETERSHLERLSRAQSAPAVQVTRARILLAVADGDTFVRAAQRVGRKDGDPIAALVKRFNQEGIEALTPRHAGGPPIIYGPKQRARVLAMARKSPTPKEQGCSQWSLTTLQKALHTDPNGVPGIKLTTIRTILHDAGFTWQQDRSWVDTGKVLRKRKAGLVEVSDPDAGAKKT